MSSIQWAHPPATAFKPVCAPSKILLIFKTKFMAYHHMRILMPTYDTFCQKICVALFMLVSTYNRKTNPKPDCVILFWHDWCYPLFTPKNKSTDITFWNSYTEIHMDTFKFSYSLVFRKQIFISVFLQTVSAHQCKCSHFMKWETLAVFFSSTHLHWLILESFCQNEYPHTHFYYLSAYSPPTSRNNSNTLWGMLKLLITTDVSSPSLKWRVNDKNTE